MAKILAWIFHLFAASLSIISPPICSQSPPNDDHFRHSLLSKFLYQFHDQKNPSAGAGLSPSLLFPPHRIANLGHPSLMGLPPPLSSTGLLVPIPPQSPPTFRFPLTAMAQHKAFPVDDPHHHRSLPPSLLLLGEGNGRAEEEGDGHQGQANKAEKAINIGEGQQSSSTMAQEEGRSSASEWSTKTPLASAASSTIVLSTTTPIAVIGASEQQNGTTSQGPPPSAAAGGNVTIGPFPSMNLESFLRSANLSVENTAEFMRLLEAEVARRLEGRMEKSRQKEEKGGGGDGGEEVQEEEEEREGDGEEMEGAEGKRTAEKSEQEVQRQAEGQLTAEGGRGARVELKTVNTRLFSLASGEAASEQEKRSQPAVEAINKEDYRQKEQAEFDRLLGQLAEERGDGGGGRKKEEGPPEDGGDLLLVVQNEGGGEGQSRGAPIWAANNGTTTRPPSPTMMQISSSAKSVESSTSGQEIEGNGQQQRLGEAGLEMSRRQRFWSRNGPKNKFERLVEDYRYRLGGQDGQNGLNDLVKALRNSHIGFFDRTANPQAVKILRRIDRRK